MSSMVVRNPSSTRRWRSTSGFTGVLTSAVLEWLLIFLLFVNGLFSYLVTRLARFCELQTPCLLCSRLDHLFGNESPGFYLDLICGSHKLEISSLVFCHVHSKLADVYGMCESCLFSFATEKKSNSETYRLLVGTLGADFECCEKQEHLVKEPVVDCSSQKICSCCNKPWTSRLETHKVVEIKSPTHEVAELDIPLPTSVEKRLSEVHDEMEHVEKISRDVEFTSLQPEAAKLDIPSPTSVEKRHSEVHDGLEYVEKISGDVEFTGVQPEASKHDTPSPASVEENPLHSHDDMEYNENISMEVESPIEEPEVAKLDIPSPASLEKNHLQVHDGLKNDENISREVESPSEEPEVVKLDIPSPASVGKNVLQVHDGLEYMEKASREVGSSSVGANTFDPLAHIGYSQINVTSDTESEVQFSDDDDKSSLDCGQNELHGEIKTQPFDPQSPHSLPKTLSDDLVPERSIHHGSVSERTLLIPQPQNVEESIGSTSPGDAFVDETSVEGISSLQVEVESDATHPELISLHDVLSPAIAREVPVEDLAESSNATVTDVPQPPSIQELYKTGSGSMKSSEPITRTNLVINERDPSMTNLMDLSDAYKLVIDNKGNEATSSTEQATVKDSPRVSGDLKLWLSQISSARAPEFSVSEIISPRVYGQWDDPKMYDAPSPIGLQILQKRISLERNMSGFESLDGSIVSEVEGESMVDRLKRQVEYDRKSITTLYKELEEERNASAISANQALAMITRLQEEKSTLQTEALQYLRMMEEQAEYDVDALQKANELLAEKEKEIQVLEAELEIYRAKFPLEGTSEDTQEVIHDSERGNKKMDYLDISRSGFNISTPCNTPRELFEERKQPGKTRLMNGSTSTQIMEDSLVGFEDERSYISERLKTIEKKLHLYSNNGVHFSNGRYSGKEENGENYLRELHYEDMIPGSYQTEVDGVPADKSSLPLDSQYDGNQNYNSDYEGKDHDNEVASLEHEIHYLNERLKALESDRNFLEHTINSLQTGDGIQFIQEIAHDLRELRKVGIRRDEELH